MILFKLFNVLIVQSPTVIFDLKFCSEMIFQAINSWFGDGLEHFYYCDLNSSSLIMEVSVICT